MSVSKWKNYDANLTELLQDNKNCTDTEIAKKLLNTNEGGNVNKDVDLLRTYIKRNRLRLLDEHEGIYNATNELDVPNTSVKHMWLKTKQSSIFVKNPEYIEPLEEEENVTEVELKQLIKEGFENIKYNPIKNNNTNKVGVVKIADLHLGSYVDNLIRTKQFSIDILANKLLESVEDINNRNYSTVHVHILGDLIESFTGLSHKNTWKGLDKAMVGAEAVKLVVKILHDNFLSKIVNLGEVKVVAGNHDRITSDNKEDVQGGAANLVCWGLELIGYKVEFNSLVITHTIGKITHILTHGHHALSKRSTKQICWDYGVQGNYNLICEGHLHSIIQKLNVNQRDNYQTIKDDAVDHRRMNCPSYFTGNFYSESLGYTSESGFVITEDNGRGVPNVFYYAV